MFLFAYTEGCCVGRAWHGRAAAGGRVVLGRAGVPRCILKQIVLKIPNDVITITTTTTTTTTIVRTITVED